MRTIEMLPILGLVFLTTTGCAVKKIAVNKIGDAIASGGQVYASDDDPELVREAAPFSLKLIESLLAESPRHRGLRVHGLTTADKAGVGEARRASQSASPQRADGGIDRVAGNPARSEGAFCAARF